MSLNWDLSKITDSKELMIEVEVEGKGKGWKLDPLTESMIWMSMVTGLGKGWTLDLDFAPEFYARLKMLEKLNGPLVTKLVDGKREAYEVTLEDVFRRVGLHVNVSPVTRAQFLKNAVAVDLDRDKRKAEQHRASLAVEAA